MAAAAIGAAVSAGIFILVAAAVLVSMFRKKAPFLRAYVAEGWLKKKRTESLQHQSYFA